jgi:hypothetical protein
MNARWLGFLAIVAWVGSSAKANEPVASYIFPAGGQRGTSCAVRVGGLFLHEGCDFHWASPGLKITSPLTRVPTIWFEGPLIPLPESQQAEDYPRDFAARVEIAPDAPLGPGYWRLSTSEGVTAARRFIVGQLPEIVEEEIDGDPIPVAVTLPVTINGRIFPREDVDVWSFHAQAGQAVRAEVSAARLGSPLEPRLEIVDAQDRPLAEAVGSSGEETNLAFTAPADGTYSVRIHDVNFGGLQHYVYRLSLSSGPHVSSVFPLGGRRGEKARFQLIGFGVGDEPIEVALPATAEPTCRHRFDVGGQLTNPVLLELDDLSEHIEREANDDAGHAEAVSMPGIVNGRIQTPGDADWFAFSAAKDQVYDMDLRASRLGSPLDGVLTVFNSEGTQLARSDDMADGNTDSQCRFTAPADGRFLLRVEDRLASRGGATFAYRLRLDVAQPDFRLVLGSDAINFVRGQEAKLRVDVQSLAPLDVPIDLTVEGLPEGVAVAPTQIAAKARQVELKFTVPERTPIRTGRLTVRGRAKIGNTEIARTAAASVRRDDPPLEHALWAVAMRAPFKFVGTFTFGYEPRGGYVERQYRLLRGGYDGPLEISLADKQLRHLQGVSGPAVMVGAGAETFAYKVYLPPWMELGRTSRTCLTAAANVTDFDGSRHPVSFSTMDQNEQIVVRVSSGLLGLTIDPESVLAPPGGSATIGVNLAREPTQTSSVRVELVVPPHIHGVRAEPLVLDAGQSGGSLKIACAPGCGEFNMPLVVRATSQSPARPAVAEAKLELVAPR